MNIIFLRHAIAKDREDFLSAKDSERPLTKKGMVEFQSFLNSLADLLPQADLIITSPYTRARQTAEILQGIFGGQLKVYKGLEPGQSSQSLLKCLKNYHNIETIYLIGHQPDLGVHLDYFVKEIQLETGDSLCQFKKGGFVWLKSAKTLVKGRFKIVCSMHPPQLRKLKPLEN